MNGYFDSSALLKLVVDEEGSDLAADIWNGCDAAFSSRLAIAEVAAALAAAERAHRLDGVAAETARRSWSVFARALRWVELDHELAGEAAHLASLHALSGADAVHLAGVRLLGSSGTVVVTWDRRLWAAARNEGLATTPGEEPR